MFRYPTEVEDLLTQRYRATLLKRGGQCFVMGTALCATWCNPKSLQTLQVQMVVQSPVAMEQNATLKALS